MGVPSFFKWVMTTYKRRINELLLNLVEYVHNFYIDANCLIHPVCFKTIADYPDLRGAELEEKMFENILEYIRSLISHVSPLRKVYIAVDGPAPMAKINQQRQRRYKSVYDEFIRNEIKKKHGKEVRNDEWSNIVISPGTMFMERLHMKIYKLCEELAETKPNMKIIYSSYHTNGEGEHKILDDIRLQHEPEVNVIYGLDADLIFLAISSMRDNIYLLRETQEFGMEGSNNFLYVCIDEFKSCVNETILNHNLMESKWQFYKDANFVYDFVVICFLLGNDFLPHLPSVDINTRGLEFLIKCYVQTLNDGKLMVYYNRKMGKYTISTAKLKYFITRVSSGEHKYFSDLLAKSLDKNKEKKCEKTDPYEREIWELENMVYDTPDIFGYMSDTPDIYKYNYYMHYYNNTSPELIGKLCHEYLKGVMWVFSYYFNGCVSQSWFFRYLHAPFISDIANFLKVSEGFDVSKITFKKNDMNSASAFEQLLMIVPPKRNYVLPKQLRQIQNHKEMSGCFPKKINVDVYYKTKFFKCVAIIEPIGIANVRNIVANLKFPEHVNKLNETYTDFVFN